MCVILWSVTSRSRTRRVRRHSTAKRSRSTARRTALESTRTRTHPSSTKMGRSLVSTEVARRAVSVLIKTGRHLRLCRRSYNAGPFTDLPTCLVPDNYYSDHNYDWCCSCCSFIADVLTSQPEPSAPCQRVTFCGRSIVRSSSSSEWTHWCEVLLDGGYGHAVYLMPHVPFAASLLSSGSLDCCWFQWFVQTAAGVVFDVTLCHLCRLLVAANYVWEASLVSLCPWLCLSFIVRPVTRHRCGLRCLPKESSCLKQWNATSSLWLE